MELKLEAVKMSERDQNLWDTTQEDCCQNVSSFECSPKKYQARGSDCRSMYGDDLQKVRQEMCTCMNIKKSYRNGLRWDFYSGLGEF